MEIVMLLGIDSSGSVLAGLRSGVLDRRAYTPYGFQQVEAPESSSLGFNGQLLEGLTGRYHLGHGHRVYNPVLMRFQTPDTLSPFDAGGLNAYAYCQGDPVNFTDPTGQFVLGLSNAFSLFKTVTRHTRKVSQAFFSTRPATYTSRLYQAGYTVIGTGAVMHVAGFASGAVVMKAGGALLTAVDMGRKVQKTFKTLSSTRLGKAVVQRFKPGKPSVAPLEEVKVIKPTSPGVSVDIASEPTHSVSFIRST
ncbi:RHS repeat-associated core domain-containing protein [Pseudomonas syringae]|nr:RHS repeat-associated core domain-containing protein [Pseudomonas syringae]MBD8793022.1 RHS repeat-associated core domain-containing protein [Pseudomonas syringae]MBD8803635.1 RHS repeat-associated core domain-containing protein [Pseudomonas syringae]MBD8811948.1 RHS repeat-associated core domain-containing protein [Pseudomonas syringae]